MSCESDKRKTMAQLRKDRNTRSRRCNPFEEFHQEQSIRIQRMTCRISMERALRAVDREKSWLLIVVASASVSVDGHRYLSHARSQRTANRESGGQP